MPNFKNMRVLKKAAEQALELGLVSETGSEFEQIGRAMNKLREMARESAPLTSKKGNRRFENYVLKITNNYISSVSLLNWNFCEECNDQGYTIMHEPCECESGCKKCRGSREIRRKIPCQSCNPPKPHYLTNAIN